MSDYSIFAEITADASGYEKGVKRAQKASQNLSLTVGELSKTITKALSFAGVAIGTKAIVDFGKSCVKSATQAQKVFNILDNTVKATGAYAWTSTKELESASKSLSDSTNYSITEIQKMQSVLLGFTNITGEAFDGASEAVLDMATVMDMDLTSAVQTVGKALDDPITGLDSLRRQGFKFTDEQKAELSQLVKTGKQLEAQKIILDTLATSYGGASKSGQDSFAKQRHAVENFSDALGGKLIPLMKSFAIDNANMIDSLRGYLDEIDFNQIGATIKVTFDGIKKGIQNSFEYVKMIFSETKSFMKNIDFKPIVSIINNLVGAFEKIGKINLSRITNIIKDLKDSFSGFSENIDLTKFSEVINLIINGFVFLYEEVSKVFDTLLDNIKTFITNTWNSIKSVFEAGNKALADSETDIKSWGDYFYTAFNNLFKTVQDVIQSISYLLSGDWEIAWQYAKLVVLRIVDGVIDSMTTMVTAFKDKIINILNFAQMLSPFLGTSGKVIKTALSGIEALVDGIDENSKKIKDTMTELVEDTENKIEELTGKPADKNIKELNKFTAGSKNILGEFVDNFKEATDKVKKELDNLSGEYKATNNSMKADGKSTYEAFSEWDSKLLKQRQGKLSEYSKEHHEINLQLIDQERKKALEDEKNEEERAKINEYYNNEIEEENERFEEAKREKARETFHFIMAYTKKFLQDTVAGFKKVADIFKKVLSGIGNFVKNVFDKLKNIFSTLFDFNIDDALNNLLKIEDAILTFFVETLPRLPNFFESAFSSVLTLIQTLINSIDWDNVKNILDSIIKTFVTYSPQIVSGIVEIFTNLVSTVSAVLVENAPEIVSAIGEMFFTILEALPSIISNFIKVVGTYLSEIGKYFTNNFDRLSEDLSNIIKSFIDGIAEFISSGGWKNLLDGLLSIQKALEKAITDNIDSIVDTIISALPDLVDMLIESIVSASKTLAKLIKPIIKLILAIISALIDILTSDEVMDASLDAVMALIDAIFDELLPGILKLIPKLIVKIIAQVVKNFPKIVKSIVDGLVKAFVNTNWFDIVKQIFMGFIDAFKDLFGIHSPSTLFEGFGLNIIEGLVNGLKGIAEAVMIILQPLINAIQSLFSGLFSFISDVIGKILDAVTSINQMSFDALEKVIGGLIDSIGKISDSLTAVTKISFDALNTSIGTVVDSLTKITELSFGAISDLANISFETLKTTLNSISDVLKTISSTAVDLVDVSFKGLKDVIEAIGNSVTNMTNSVAGLVNALKDLVEAVNKGMSALNPFGGGSSSGGSSGGGSSGNQFDDPFDYVDPLHLFPGHAIGTNNASAGLSIVGEAGPELVKFRGGEQVLNNRNTNKALEGMGGKSIVNNVTFNNLQDTTAFAMMNQLKAYNRQLAINGVI